MISLKDIPVYLSIAGTVFGGGAYINSLQRDVAELSADYRAHVVEQQEVSLMEKKWKLEDRLQKVDDPEARKELDVVNRLLEKNQMQQQQLKGGKP